MNEVRQNKSKHKHPCSVMILTFVVFLSVTVGLCWYYSPHLYWKYFEMTTKPRHFEKIPCSPMPMVEIPVDWLEYSWKDMRFRLPPDILMEDDVERALYCVMFRGENIEIGITHLSLDIPDPFLELALRIFPEESFLTRTQLCLRSFEVGSGDFSWSMGRQEALQFVFCMTNRDRMINVPANQEICESFSTKNWDGLLGSIERNFICDIETTCCFANGRKVQRCIIFVPADDGQGAEALDINIIRGIIQSVEINCACSPIDK